MKVKMKKAGAGPNGAFKAGDIVGYFSDASCEQLIKSRQAVPVEDELEPVKKVIAAEKAEESALIETATVNQPEDSAWPSKRKKRSEKV